LSVPKILRSERIYRGRALNLRVDTIQMLSGRTTTREVVEHGGSVAIVAIDADDNVLLVRQFREPVGEVLLEIPAGGIDPHEEPDACAQRELREETGYCAERMERLGGFYSSPGFCTEYMHLFLATKLCPSPLVAADTEAIELVRVPLNEVRGLITSGEICDAKTIAGLLLVLGKRKGELD